MLSGNSAAQCAAIVLAGLATGALLTYALQRGLGLERKSSPAGRHVSARALLDALASALPQSSASEAESARALARAGMRIAPSALWAARLASTAAGVAAGALLALVIPGASTVALACPVLGGVAGAAAPQLWLIRKRGLWRDEIDRELPNALDLLCITVTAGGTLEFGVRTVAERTEGALADAFGEAVEAAEFVPMTTALQRLAENAGVRSLSVFVASLIQAERSGMAIADILAAQAVSVRTARRQQIEERINKIPLQMTFPMMLIFFSTLLVVLVPAMAQVLAGLS